VYLIGQQSTDGQTEFSSLYRVCITCSAVKINQNVHKILYCSEVPRGLAVDIRGFDIGIYW